jgi:hypothetical protein
MTSLGMRVIVAPADVAPVDRSPGFVPAEGGAGAVAAARAAEAEEATEKANEARLAVFKASRAAAQAMVPVRVAESAEPRSMRDGEWMVGWGCATADRRLSDPYRAIAPQDTADCASTIVDAGLTSVSIESSRRAAPQCAH